MLNPYEQRQLQEIEHWFEANDPRLAEYVRSTPVQSRSKWRPRLLMALAMIGGVIVLLGLVLAHSAVVFAGLCFAIGGISAWYWLRGEAPSNAGEEE